MLKNIKTKIKQGTYNSLFPSKRKPEKQMPASDIEEKKQQKDILINAKKGKKKDDKQIDRKPLMR